MVYTQCVGVSVYVYVCKCVYCKRVCVSAGACACAYAYACVCVWCYNISQDKPVGFEWLRFGFPEWGDFLLISGTDSVVHVDIALLF